MRDIFREKQTQTNLDVVDIQTVDMFSEKEKNNIGECQNSPSSGVLDVGQLSCSHLAPT